MSRARDERGARLGAAVVLAVAVAAHLSFAVLAPPIVWVDSHRYAILAADLPRRLAAADWDLWTTPAYPAFLWAVHYVSARLDRLVLLQQAIACGAAVLSYAIARAIVGPRGALVGGLLVALSPIRHYYGQSVLTESLAEAFLIAGTAAATRSLDRAGDAALAWRALSGLALGLATLTRPNLAAALAAAIVLPMRDARGRWLRATALAAAVTAVAAACVLLPWLRFNANRGVEGLTGNVGSQVHGYANTLRVGAKVDTRALMPHYSPAGDERLLRAVVGRVLAEPRAAATAIAHALRSLAIPVRPTGDVGPNIWRCAWTTDQPLAGWDDASPPRDRLGWRCRVHRALLAPVSIAITLGWLGLLVVAGQSLSARRFDRAGICLIPIACLASLALLLQANTRYAAPFEPLALGIGVAGIVELVFRWRLAPDARRDGVGADDGARTGERTGARVVPDDAVRRPAEAHVRRWVAATALATLVLAVAWGAARAPAPAAESPAPIERAVAPAAERPAPVERAVAETPRRFLVREGRRRPWCPVEEPARRQMSLLRGSRAGAEAGEQDAARRGAAAAP